MSEKVRLGIVGCGVIGKEHLKAALRSPDVEVLALADLRADVARAAAHEFNIPRVFESGDALVRSDVIDAVVLAMPTGARASVASAALDAGKHVLLEKPPAMDAQELAALAARRGDRLIACASSRFSLFDSTRAAADAVACGTLGDLRIVRFRGVAAATRPKQPPPAWRLNRALNGGGILVNWGIYDLDYLFTITNWKLRPRLVIARGWRTPEPVRDWVAPGSDAETHVAGTIVCDGGVVVQFERGELLPMTSENAWQVIGERGTLRLDMLWSDDKQVVHDAYTEVGIKSTVIWRGAEPVGALHGGPVLDFAAAIREGRRPATDIDRALVLQRVVDAIYRSAATGSVAAVE